MAKPRCRLDGVSAQSWVTSVSHHPQTGHGGFALIWKLLSWVEALLGCWPVICPWKYSLSSGSIGSSLLFGTSSCFSLRGKLIRMSEIQEE